MATKKQINTNDCYNLILNAIYEALKDKHCFYRYHISDKKKDDQGNIVSVINEVILNKIDTKMLKEILSSINDIASISQQGDTQSPVIILKDVESINDTII